MNSIINNTESVLAEVLAAIQHLDDRDLLYPKSATTYAYLEALGIRSVIYNSRQGALVCPFRKPNGSQETSSYQWRSFQKAPIIEDLQICFSNCRVISFAEWSDINGASDLWDGLRHDVIKPLQKKDFDFVFYLGYVSKKAVYEVDEILDIISDFSGYGRVSLVMDKAEADKLWMMLNGYEFNKPFSAIMPPGPDERYRSIFDTMKISHLLVHTADRMLSFTRQDQTEIISKADTNIGTVKYVRDNFNAGYSLGLQLGLDLLQCIVFGLAMAGSYRETGVTPNQPALLSYIKKWMAGLRPSAFGPLKALLS